MNDGYWDDGQYSAEDNRFLSLDQIYELTPKLNTTTEKIHNHMIVVEHGKPCNYIHIHKLYGVL